MSENKDIIFTGERVVEGKTPERIWSDHKARYEFAAEYVKDKIVLDISCGTGYGSKILYKRGAAKVIGIDISSDSIDFAVANYKTKGIDFEVGNILSIPYPENYYDVITCFETIEHINSQEKVLSELKRVLKPNGLLIISSPNRKLTSPFKSIKDKPNNRFHIVEYTEEEFAELLGKYFEVLEIYGQRAIHKSLVLPIQEKFLRKLASFLYNPNKGNSSLEKVLFNKEYRYITVVCKKELEALEQ
jgi:ubiquinone/menaquinone biosynthesis C-methylase UbiE